jgi:Tol biopolymer transport system component
MNADPRIQERLHRAADPVSVDVEARLESARRRAGRRQVARRIGTGLVAALIGAAALAAIWSVRLGDGSTPLAPEGLTGTLVYSPASNTTAPEPQLRALRFDDGASDAAYGWLGTSPTFTTDGSAAVYLVETERDRDGIPLYDIVVRSLPDGPETVVLEDVATINRPFLGPEGEVAYLEYGRDGTTYLRVATGGGTDVRTVAEGNTLTDFSWSPDGSTFAVTGQIAPSPGLILTDADGRDRREVALPPGSTVWGMNWSPDGSLMAFTATSPDRSPSLWLVRSDGTGLRSFPTDATWEGAPVWSPDGRWIAFTSDRDATPEQRASNRRGDSAEGFDLYVMHPDGSDVHRLVANDGPGMTTAVAWFPGSANSEAPPPPAVAEPTGALLWANKGVAGPEGTGLPHVYVQQADGSDEPVEIEDPPVFVAPDGSKIMWEEYLGDRLSDLVVGNPDRSEPVVVATLDLMNVRWLDWSRDGSRIAYTYDTDDGMELWVTDVTTGEGSVISAMPGMLGVSWAPDGSRVAIAVGTAPTGTPGVYTMAPDGADLQRVSELDCVELAWSPDGDDIAVTGERLGNDDTAGLWIVDVAGSDRGSEDLIEPGASSPMWSPDGAWLLYSAVDPGSDDEQPVALYLMRPDGGSDRMLVPDPGEGWPIPWAWVEDWPL